jgi:hypothetical protein
MDYNVEYSFRRSVAIHINEEGEVIVKAPRFVSSAFIEDFVRSKQKWIDRSVIKVKARHQHKRTHTFQSGDSFWYLGQEYPLVIDPRSGKKINFKQGFYTKATSATEIKKFLFNWYKTTSHDLLEVRLMIYAQQNSLTYSKYRLTSAKTRWGSCSGAGVISLNWKLVMMPLDIIDYVVAHELSHLVHHNHSKRFWDYVTQIVPDWKMKRKWLKEHGAAFTF